MKRIKQALCILLILLLSFAAILPCAGTDDRTVEPGSVPVSLDILDPQRWNGNDAVLYIDSRSFRSKSAMYIFAREQGDTTLSISAPFDTPLDFSSLRELMFTMRISGSGVCDFTVTILCEGVYHNASSKISAGEETSVYLPLPDGAKGAVDALSLTLSRRDEPIKSIYILSAAGDDRFSYTHTDRFMSAGFEPTSGTMQEQENCVFISPQNGTASFYPRYIINSRQKEGSAAVYLRIKSAQASGTITVHGGTGATPQTILSGEHTYAFLTDGPFADLEYVFSGISAAQDSPLVITGAAISLLPDSLTEGIGNITACSSDGKTVTVKGTLSPDTVVEYIDGELALYAIPIWADETDLLQGEPVAKMSISTRFELSAVPSDLDMLCKYKVMILSEEDKIPVAPCVFLSSGGTASVLSPSVTGMHGTDTVDIFESNVSNTIIDIHGERLFETSDVHSALLYVVGNTHYYFNRSYLEELDAQIQFSISSGIKVYLRLLDPSGYTAVTQEKVMRLYALSAFLSQRYQNITGFILGSHANLDYSENTEIFASYAALFSAIVKRYCPGTAAVIPVCDAYTDNNAEDSIAAADPARFLCQLAASMSKKKSDNIMLLYECNSRPQRAVLESASLASLITICGHPCDGSLLFWQPSAGTDASIGAMYQSLCTEALRAGVRCVILSISDLNATNSLFDTIKETVFQSTSSGLHQRVAEKDSNNTYLGTYPLWDFSTAYDTGGWVSGGGFNNVFSANAENNWGRVIQTQLVSEKNQAGILLCWLDTPLDLSGSSVKFSFGLYDALEDTECSIIFGSGKSRAEYMLTTNQNTEFTATCNLKDFSDASGIEYIAVILRSSSSPLIQISKIEVCSDEKDSEQLRLLAKGAQKEPRATNPVYYFIIVIMTVATVVTFTVLRRKSSRSKSTNPSNHS